MGVHRFTELRAWQACDVFKKAVYALCRSGPLSRDLKLRSQLEDPEAALGETTGLMEYLQSPEALRNARRARERRIASRDQRRAEREQSNRESPNPEPRTEPEPEHEPSSENQEA